MEEAVVTKTDWKGGAWNDVLSGERGGGRGIATLLLLELAGIQRGPLRAAAPQNLDPGLALG